MFTTWPQPRPTTATRRGGLEWKDGQSPPAHGGDVGLGGQVYESFRAEEHAGRGRGPRSRTGMVRGGDAVEQRRFGGWRAREAREKGTSLPSRESCGERRMRRCTYELKKVRLGQRGRIPRPPLLPHASVYSPPHPIGGFRAHDAIILIIYTLRTPNLRGES